MIRKMAGNVRGKLKEQFEGIHNNFSWVSTHIERALILLEDKKPELSKAIETLDEGVKTLDKLAQDIYSRL